MSLSESEQEMRSGIGEVLRGMGMESVRGMCLAMVLVCMLNSSILARRVLCVDSSVVVDGRVQW